MAKEAVVEETALAKTSPEQIQLAYRAILDGDVIPEVGDPEVISRAVMERIMAAETFEDTFAPQKLEGWKAFIDVPVFVRDFHLNKSGFERADGGSSVFAVVDLARADGNNWPDGHETITVTCGGRNVLMQLVKALEKGWLDRAVKLTSRPTSEGYNVLWLEAA